MRAWAQPWSVIRRPNGCRRFRAHVSKARAARRGSRLAVHLVAGQEEEVGDGVMDRDEALNVAGRLEPLHLAFSSAGWLVGVLRPVVKPLVLAMLDAGHDLLLRRAVGAQLVQDVVAIQSVSSG